MRGSWLTAVATLHLLIAVDVTTARTLAPQLSNQSAVSDVQSPTVPLKLVNTAPGKPIKPGTELRILPVGDSITYGFLSDQDGGDGNGYRLRLRELLSKDKVVFAGTETSPTGNMTDGWFVWNRNNPSLQSVYVSHGMLAAWNGKTIQYISDHVTPSLEQRPNIILLHAGTNDMNPNSSISTEGHDPIAASERLGRLVDKMTASCPDAVILVAMIIGTCKAEQAPQTKVFQSLIPKVVAPKLKAGKHVLAVDFATFPLDDLRDCIHPKNEGYQLLGHYWYDFIAQIPQHWITAPVGDDPQRPEENPARRLHTNMPLLGLFGMLLVLMYA